MVTNTKLLAWNTFSVLGVGIWSLLSAMCLQALISLLCDIYFPISCLIRFNCCAISKSLEQRTETIKVNCSQVSAAKIHFGRNA